MCSAFLVLKQRCSLKQCHCQCRSIRKQRSLFNAGVTGLSSPKSWSPGGNRLAVDGKDRDRFFFILINSQTKRHFGDVTFAALRLSLADDVVASSAQAFSNDLLAQLGHFSRTRACTDCTADRRGDRDLFHIVGVVIGNCDQPA